MRVLLDLNVILDFLLGREPWRVEADALWDANRDGRLAALLSAASPPTIFYVIRKQADTERARLAVEMCLRYLTIVPVDGPTLDEAILGPSDDFEDNVQIACAVRGRADLLVTRDPKGFARSPVPALSPAELVARLAPSAPDAP